MKEYITIQIDSEMLNRINQKLDKSIGENRSLFIRNAVKKHLDALDINGC